MPEAKTCGYYGTVRTGKTTLALKEALADAGASWYPLLIIDSMGASTFDTIRSRYEVKGLPTVCDRVWRGGKHTLFMPRDPEEVEQLAAVAFTMGHAGKRCAILIDETSAWFNAWARPPELSKLIRSHRHCGVSVYLTTQYLGDLSPAFLQCVEYHRIFQNSSPRALARIRDTFPGIDIEAVQGLTVGQHIDFPPKASKTSV